jgi:HSP20 family molecular chaperone IbpA
MLSRRHQSLAKKERDMTALAPVWLFDLLSPLVRTFDALTSGSWKSMLASASQKADAMQAEPAFALEETEDAYVLRALVPGASSATLKVEVEGTKLRLTGTSRVRFESRHGLSYLREWPVAETITLPPDADGSCVECGQQGACMVVVRIPRHQTLDVEASVAGGG